MAKTRLSNPKAGVHDRLGELAANGGYRASLTLMGAGDDFEHPALTNAQNAQAAISNSMVQPANLISSAQLKPTLAEPAHRQVLVVQPDDLAVEVLIAYRPADGGRLVATEKVFGAILHPYPLSTREISWTLKRPGVR
jgi:hypothetical protein